MLHGKELLWKTLANKLHLPSVQIVAKPKDLITCVMHVASTVVNK